MKTLKNSLSLRGNLFAGILILVPLGAVLWILVSLWRMLMGIANVIPDSLNPSKILGLDQSLASLFFDSLLTLIVIISVFLIIWLIGLASRLYIGKLFLQVFRRLIDRVPIIRTIYTTLESMIEALGKGGKSSNFRRVIRIQYPRKGIYSLALVTGELPNDILTVFVPTTPNPTSGFYLQVPKTEAENLDIGVEDALKEIVSVGLVKNNGKDKK